MRDLIEQKASISECEKEWRERQLEEKIDRILEDSFPASDPPGWTLGVESREIGV